VQLICLPCGLDLELSLRLAGSVLDPVLCLFMCSQVQGVDECLSVGLYGVWLHIYIYIYRYTRMGMGAACVCTSAFRCFICCLVWLLAIFKCSQCNLCGHCVCPSFSIVCTLVYQLQFPLQISITISRSSSRSSCCSCSRQPGGN